MTTVIYGIIDPRTLELMYVGKTKHSIEWRLRGHPKAKNNSSLVKWMNASITAGIFPEIFVIEEVDDGDWKEAERFWISYYRTLGCNLLNLTRGGNGFGNHSVESRAKISAAKVSAENIQKIPCVKYQEAAQRNWDDPNSLIRHATEGIPRSAEVIAATSLGVRLKWQDPEYRARRDALEQTPEIRENRKKASNVRWSKPNAKDQNRRPEIVAKIAAKLRELWQDPEYKERMKESARRRGHKRTRTARGTYVPK